MFESLISNSFQRSNFECQIAFIKFNPKFKFVESRISNAISNNKLNSTFKCFECRILNSLVSMSSIKYQNENITQNLI